MREARGGKVFRSRFNAVRLINRLCVSAYQKKIPGTRSDALHRHRNPGSVGPATSAETLVLLLRLILHRQDCRTVGHSNNVISAFLLRTNHLAFRFSSLAAVTQM